VPAGKTKGRAPSLRSTLKTDPLPRVRRICLALPETQEKEAWGAPTFRVCGKIFVTFVDNHHNDGRVALWCNAPPGAQQGLVASDPEHLFVPPYVGCRGWLGVRLDKGLDWSIITELIKEAYRATAPEHYSLR
jgi:hypothetical protein